jgi:hypothetical protein
VEEVGTVPVDLDAGLGLIFAVRVAADVVAAVQDGDLQPQLRGGAFRDCQAKKTRTDYDEISVHNSPVFFGGRVQQPYLPGLDYPIRFTWPVSGTGPDLQGLAAH